MRMPALGEVIAGKYRIEEVLGQGAFGYVFRGITDLSNRPVAIKILKPKQGAYDERHVARFQRELRAIAKLTSPCTLTMFDYGRTPEGLLFMVTEFVDGRDLAELLTERGTLTEREAAHVIAQVLQSLDEAHGVGILHRDIKPSNIRLYEYQGDPLRVKLLDFGLARSFGSDEARLTGTGKVIGTPRYMSPEQLSGEALSPASDIFSVGLVAAECVAGRAETLAESVSRRLDESTPVSSAFRGLINEMLEPAPKNRPRAGSLSVRFGEIAASRAEMQSTATDKPRARSTARSASSPPDTSAPRRELARGRAFIFVGAGLALVVLAFLAFALAHHNPEGTKTHSPVARTLPESLLVAPPEVTSAQSATAPAPGARPAPERRGCQEAAAVGHVVLEIPGDLLDAPEEFELYIPATYDAETRHPLIVAFYEFASGPQDFLRRQGLGELADRHGVIVLPLRGTGLPGSLDDIEIRDAVDAIRSVANHLCVDPAHVYAYGHGDAGLAVHMLRCAYPQLAATATTAYRFDEGPPCAVDRAIPHLSAAALQDGTKPLDGGRGCGRFSDKVMSLDDHEDHLRRSGVCSGDGESWFDHQFGACRQWPCENGARVICRIDGGREFSGRRTGLGINPRCDGPPVAFPYTDVIWRFFEEVTAHER